MAEEAYTMTEGKQLLKIAGITCLLYTSNQQHMTEVLREKLGEDFPVPCFLSEAAEPVSYTHLDVYKRQVYPLP